jgi:hypothetical protein
MSKQVTPEIEAEITFLPSADGGRISALSQGEYRGVLTVGSESFSVRFWVAPDHGISPGESGKFGIQFLAPEAAVPHFTKGVSFTVWEGKVIGHGLVVEVLSHA